MKKHKKIILVLIIIIFIVCISYAIYAFSNSNNTNTDNNQEKIISEIKYLENKFLSISNSLNNIEYENYKINVDKINTSNKSNDSSSSNDSKSSNNSGDSNSSSNGENSNNSKNETNNKYNLESQGILTNKTDINWGNIKNELELLYTSTPVITLDLYQINLNKEDILNFNKELDNLIVSVSKENKEETLSELSKLYSYLPKFLENTNVDENYKTVLKTKSNILEAYSILDSEDWQFISNKISDGINTYNSLLTNVNNKKSKQYDINKCYIMLNELQSSISTKNKEIFLIKYKNLLEEINNI